MRALKSAGFTILAVIDPQIHSPEELHAILGLFEGEINIREKESEKDLQKLLKIRRMSNQKYLEDELLEQRTTLTHFNQGGQNSYPNGFKSYDND